MGAQISSISFSLGFSHRPVAHNFNRAELYVAHPSSTVDCALIRPPATRGPKLHLWVSNVEIACAPQLFRAKYDTQSNSSCNSSDLVSPAGRNATKTGLSGALFDRCGDSSRTAAGGGHEFAARTVQWRPRTIQSNPPASGHSPPD